MYEYTVHMYFLTNQYIENVCRFITFKYIGFPGDLRGGGGRVQTYMHNAWPPQHHGSLQIVCSTEETYFESNCFTVMTDNESVTIAIY